jgi:alpha-D-ribose 1-methylphosphonate 5-triphosphate synthase subunit PhnH
MTTPRMTEIEARNHATFTALMWALSYPGRPQPLPENGDAAATVGAALLDLETSYFTPDAALDALLARMGARRRGPGEARYQFYPALGAEELGLLAAAPLGSYAYPDDSATLVVGCELGRGARLRLRGPGVDGEVELRVGGLPAEFWEHRAAAIRYPLGWDVFLVAGRSVVGLPRTTAVEVGAESGWPT